MFQLGTILRRRNLSTWWHAKAGLLRSPPSSFTRKNKYVALVTIDGLDSQGQVLHEETILAACSGYHKKKRHVLVVGDPLLKGIETSLFQPDRESQDVCCLPRARIWDITVRVPQLVKITDYYPLLLFHVGINDARKQNMGRIKEGFKALGAQVKNMGAQFIFFIIYFLHFASWRKEQSQEETYNTYQLLCGWWQHKGFGFYNGNFYEDYNLLGRDGIYLSRRGTEIFGNRLTNLVRCEGHRGQCP